MHRTIPKYDFKIMCHGAIRDILKTTETVNMRLKFIDIGTSKYRQDIIKNLVAFTKFLEFCAQIFLLLQPIQGFARPGDVIPE